MLVQSPIKYIEYNQYICNKEEDEHTEDNNKEVCAQFVFLYCCPDHPSSPENAIQMGQATCAI